MMIIPHLKRKSYNESLMKFHGLHAKEVRILERTSVDDYIQKGLYGEKQTKPGERKKFLGTLRERVVVAITKKQVRDLKIIGQLEGFMRKHPKAKMLLNGDMDYSCLSPFIKLASKQNISFSIVNDKQSTTEIGLVLAYDHAIDFEDIYIDTATPEQKPANKKNKKDSLFTKLFRKKQ